MATSIMTSHAQERTSAPLHEVLLETDSGNIRIQLYNETPLHRDNFLKLVRSGAYDGVLFHRVIKDFMQSQDRLLAILPNAILYLQRYIIPSCCTAEVQSQQRVKAMM